LQRPVDRRVKLVRPGEFAALHLAQDLADVVTLEWRLPGQQAIERRAQRVDVRPRSEIVEIATGLLGAHVSRRAQRAAGQRLGRPARGGRDEGALAALLA